MEESGKRFHTRNQHGQINYYETLDEAMEAFLAYDGYRLGFGVNGKMVWFFRDELPKDKKPKPGSLAYDNPSKSVEYDSKIVVYRSEQ